MLGDGRNKIEINVIKIKRINGFGILRIFHEIKLRYRVSL